MPDSETLAYVAARTSTITLGTSVVDAVLHSPIVLARRLATLDRLSGGRLVAGVGVGWMSAEFEAAGGPEAQRGPRLGSWAMDTAPEEQLTVLADLFRQVSG